MTTQTADTKPRSNTNLYRVVWRWHFYAGMLVTPVMLLIAITGALYVFRTELTAWRDQEILYVTPQPERMSYEELQQIAQKHLGEQSITGLFVHPEADRSIRFISEISDDHEADAEDHAHHEHMMVYMNPYTGEVLDERIEEHDFFSIVLELHRSLMLGIPGRIIGELATSWGMILIFSGLYLWWPRGKANVGVWLPRLKGKLYPVLRDWHAVCGAYLFPLALLVVGTGMFFTVVWGTGFVATIKATGQVPVGWFGDYPCTVPEENATPASLDRIVATMMSEARPYDRVMVVLAESPDVAHRAWYLLDENKNTYCTLAVDQYTAETLLSIKCDEVPPLYKARMLAVSIHMGQIFGMPTKILAFLTSLGIVGLSITGIWMWWKRRPSGKTGFPKRPLPEKFPAWGWSVVILTGIVLPVAGLSFLIAALIDGIAARRNKIAST